MKVYIRVVANSKHQKILEVEKDHFKVWLKSKPIDGKANGELLEVLSDHYRVAKSSFFITSGLRNKDKIVEIER